MRLSTIAILAVGLISATTHSVGAAEYPERQIKLIVPFAAGGVTDVVGRLAAEFMGSRVGQRVLVENIVGAGGNSGIVNMMKSGPDGYTLGLVATGNLAINPHLFTSMPFDALKDIAPVGVIAEAPQLVVIATSVPANDLKELLAYAKANPGKINYGSAGVGTTNHLAADQFARLAGIEMAHVAYRGAAPAVNDLVGQHVQLMSVAAAPVIEHVEAGKLRALGVATAQRMSSLPKIPTIAEAGLPGYLSTTWFGIVAPAGTDGAIVSKLNGYLREMTKDDGMLAKFRTAYLEPMSLSPADFGKLIADDYAKWKTIVTTAGVKLQ